MAERMTHLNENIYCTIAIETTGPIADVHDIVEICIVPLDWTQVAKGCKPFHTFLQPRRKSTVDPKHRYKNSSLKEMSKYSINAWTAASAFMSWYEKLGIPENKRLIPIAFHWAEVRPFLIDWLGYDETCPQDPYFFMYFHKELYIDVGTLPMYWNDVSFMNTIIYPFTRQMESNVTAKVDVDFERGGSALSRAVSLAKVYRKFVEVRLHSGHGLQLRELDPIDYSEHYADEQ